MRARILAVVILLFAVLSTLTQAQVVLTDDANTLSFTPKSNYGDSIALIVCSGSNTYIKFSMANLGPGITSSNVSKATLVLYADFVLTSGTMDVYQVNGPWSEGLITYNNAPTLGAKLFSAVPVTKPGFLSLDMTPSVQAWLAGTLTNNGIALVPTTGSAISASFDSKENIFTSHPADLDLVLISAGPQGQQGMQGPQGPQGTVGPRGPTGPAGPTGPTGPTGATGPAGQQGLPGLMGLTGLTGATGPAGANGTGFNFRNGFDNSASYVANDVVTYKGSSYVATAASAGPSNPTPDTNTTAWSIMAAQGAQGPAGSAGATGAPGLAGAQGPAGATGPAGPIGQTGPPGSGGGGFSGIQEFTQSGTFTVPAGVTRLLVEMWGAGGGSGAFGGIVSYTQTSLCGFLNGFPQYCTGPANCVGGVGGGGGSGGYARGVVAVTPGGVYNVSVGAGGASGAAGPDSQIEDSSSNVLLDAGGGQPGASGSAPVVLGGTFCYPGSNGGAGAGGNAGTGTNVIGRTGNAGSTQALAGSVQLPAGASAGASYPGTGGPGYALITW